eukprot:3115681-Rhodomonas_salina.1
MMRAQSSLEAQDPSPLARHVQSWAPTLNSEGVRDESLEGGGPTEEGGGNVHWGGVYEAGGGVGGGEGGQGGSRSVVDVRLE